MVEENASTVRARLLKHLAPLVGARKLIAHLALIAVFDRRKRVAPHESHASRAKLRCGKRTKSHAAHGEWFGSDEHKKELLTVLEAVAPECVEELAVDTVKRLLESYAKKIILIIACAVTLPGEIIIDSFPIHILACLCI
jgi:hypothetical protein